MKAPSFSYHRPRTLEDAVRLLAEIGDDAKVLAGGQSLLPIMNMRLAEPAALVDVSGIRELRGAAKIEGAVRYGATTTHAMVEDQLVPDAGGGLLQQAAAGIGYRAIRNRGTVGGSLAHSDSSAEWPTVMSALDATVEVTSRRGQRLVPVRELLQGFFTTTLEADEILSGVHVPELRAERWWGLHKTARKPGEFAESLAVTLFDTDAEARVTHVELWLGAARDVPVRLRRAESMVHGRVISDLAIQELVIAISEDIGRSLDDPDPVARHGLQLHAVTVQRALSSARRASGNG